MDCTFPYSIGSTKWEFISTTVKSRILENISSTGGYFISIPLYGFLTTMKDFPHHRKIFPQQREPSTARFTLSSAAVTKWMPVVCCVHVTL